MPTSEASDPDNPRDWDVASPLLKSPMAPHETACVLRMKRAGYSGSDIMKLLKLRGQPMMGELKKALDEEFKAAKHGRIIHDAPIKED